MKVFEGALEAGGLRFAIVVSRCTLSVIGGAVSALRPLARLPRRPTRSALLGKDEILCIVSY